MRQRDTLVRLHLIVMTQGEGERERERRRERRREAIDDARSSAPRSRGEKKRFGFVLLFLLSSFGRRCFVSFRAAGESPKNAYSMLAWGKKASSRFSKSEKSEKTTTNIASSRLSTFHLPFRHHHLPSPLTFGPPAAGPAGCCDSASGSRAPRDLHVASRAAAEASRSSSSDGGLLLLLLRFPPRPPAPPPPPPGLTVVSGCR